MIRKNGAVRTTKPVDCPSGAADNGDMDRFGSRRFWENSQRGCLILRHPKSYLPTHSVIHKSAIRVLAIFADASRTGYAEAKFLLQLVRILVGDASCTGYAEAKAMSVMWFANTSRCKPHRLLCKAKANACRKAGNI